MQGLLNANPNVIAYVTGHTHENRVMACGATTGCPAGANWWEINTAAEIDWPQQSRLIEVMDNADGTLSIFGTLLDHSAPYAVPASGSALGLHHRPDGRAQPLVLVQRPAGDPRRHRPVDGPQRRAARRRPALILERPPAR